LVDDITAAREEAKRKQKEADRKLLWQRAEFDRRAKEAEMKAEEERLKLKAEMDKMSNERATANKKLRDLEKAQVAAAKHSREEQARIQKLVKKARKEKEETDQKHRDLLRSLRHQVSIFLCALEIILDTNVRFAIGSLSAPKSVPRRTRATDQ